MSNAPMRSQGRARLDLFHWMKFDVLPAPVYFLELPIGTVREGNNVGYPLRISGGCCGRRHPLRPEALSGPAGGLRPRRPPGLRRRLAAGASFQRLLPDAEPASFDGAYRRPMS